MNNYDAYSSEFFSTTREEILSMDKEWEYTPKLFTYNLAIIKNYYKHLNIKDFTIVKVPFKRSKFDNARLLCLELTDGKHIAKRVNRSQYLPIRFDDDLDFIPPLKEIGGSDERRISKTSKYINN